MYYILNDNVYQGPTLYTVLNERMVSPILPLGCLSVQSCMTDHMLIPV